MPQQTNYTKFQVGDLVTKAHGKKVAKIITIPTNGDKGWGWHNKYQCAYTHPPYAKFYAHVSELKSHDPDTSTSIMSQAKTLYEFTKPDGSTGYGTYLATNSSNQIVLEEKKTGNILTFDKDALTEVLPYTFSVKMDGSENHYVGMPGCVEKGDVVMLTSDSGSARYTIGVVTAVDTKNKSARPKFNGVKLLTQPLTA